VGLAEDPADADRRPGPLGRRIGSVPALPAAALLAGVIFLFEPVRVYYWNSPFFTFNIVQMGAVLLPAFLLCFVTLAGIGAIGSPGWRKGVAIVLAALATAAWGGASFLPASEMLLDGRTIFALSTADQWRLNAGFAALAAGGVVAAWRNPTIARQFFAALFVVLLARAGWLVAHDTKPSPTPQALDRLMTLSKERNVLVIILDTFQADFFEEILKTDPAVGSALDGFHFFPNAVGHAPTTYLSVPTIHSGRPIREGESMHQIFDRHVVEGSFVAKLAAAGYDAMMVSPIGGCPSAASCVSQESLLHGQSEALKASTRFLINLALFRVGPGFVKPLIVPEDRGARTHVIASDELFERMVMHLNTESTTPTMRFIHLVNTHPPGVLDEHCRPVAGLLWERETAIAQARCAVKRIATFVKALQDADVYDQTAMIVIGDHGAGFPREHIAETDLHWGLLASPLFLGKPFGARGALSVSADVVGLLDTAATVCSWTGDCRVDGGHDVMTTSNRPAYAFAAYQWEHRYWFEEKVPFENRFEVRGPPLDFSSWWRLTNMPEIRVSELSLGTGDAVQHFGFGWSDAEGGPDGWRWALGAGSDLYLDLDPSRDARLTLEIHTHSGIPDQTMTVEVNGKPVTQIAVPIGNPATFSFTVPARVITQGVDRILFRFARWKAVPPDPRALAMVFSHLRID
jgi:hypothetical protein